GLRYAGTSRASCMAGKKPIKPSPTGFGRKLISRLIFRAARNTSPPIRITRSSAITVYLHGTHLYCKRWKWQDCESRRWIPIIILWRTSNAMNKRTFLKLSSMLMATPVVSPLLAWAGEKLKNWAGNFEYGTERLYPAESLEQIRDFVRKQDRLKVLGTRH